MEQHPVPQQISSYEFRLVGDMTLRQFSQVAGGCLVALIFYASPLPAYLKWPFISLFVSLGVAMAFFPLEERPLPTWIVAFLKAVYSPTQFLWQKKAKKPEVFEERPLLAKMAPLPVLAGDQKRLSEYLASLPLPPNPLDQKEEDFLAKVGSLFSAIPSPQPPLAAKPSFFPTPLPSPLTFRPKQEKKRLEEAKFSPEILLPSLPEIPNLLVGMVLDKEGKIVEGAILEIRDSQGNPVRALRTNKLGQFRIATPLPNDTYEIETEEEGGKFETVKIVLQGEIVPPIEIKAK